MKLLVDENLAPELAEQIADLFPGSVHVTAVGLGSMPDAVIWEYASDKVAGLGRENGTAR